jgi:type IV pilus assembly protein PilA
MKGLISNDTSGFTLVELMVVVAIIGILASVAIPNYNRFQAKSRQSEAKVNLAAIYTAEKAYAVEMSTYSGCLNSIGFTPDGYSNVGAALANTRHYYAVGLSAGLLMTYGPTAILCAHGAGVDFWPANQTANSGTAAPATVTAPASVMTQNTFTIGAIGVVSSIVGAAADQWSINENKVLANVVPNI